ncbi:hypothetical protein [Algoriphagus sp. NG3]|uniref:hypothetical protein n=1 Tax=Algoriphagus sp. NG3 TaxID=3097546 RepID=UPI002A7EEFB2|nr:hypothetical protein [Algoriphagus sp. NG3]WPR73304.1 hypothetical protein SLW71_11515 [Algoriphagus sp. NG3]
MTNANSIPELHSLGRFVQFLAGPSTLLTTYSSDKLVFSQADKDDDGGIPPTEDFPLPDREEVNPNPEIPDEEEYLPDEEVVPVEEPQKEIEDPSFPGKGDDLPPIKEEEFPKTDPV